MKKRAIKRLFDFTFSLITFLLLMPFILVFWLMAGLDTQSLGLFLQKRVGQYGKTFTIFKLKTIHPKSKNISRIGTFLRTYKIDELPQLCNVLLGDMSIVGPRPDVIGYYDTLKGENKKILELKPGLTSLATLKYADEEILLNQQVDKVRYNDEVIFPDKVKLNLDYYKNQSCWGDLKIIMKTFAFLLNH